MPSPRLLSDKSSTRCVREPSRPCHRAGLAQGLEATPDARRSGCQQVSALATETTRTSPPPVALEAAWVGPGRNDLHQHALARRPTEPKVGSSNLSGPGKRPLSCGHEAL